MGPRRLERALVYGIARTAVGLGSLETRPRKARRRALELHSYQATSFDIYTFVTDDRVYDELRSSFAAAGFQPPLARFVALRDRRTPGGTDPYEFINRIGEQAPRPYVILTHQDVRADQGVGAPELAAALEGLNTLDPWWVVAGNAGGAPDLQLVRRLRDPYGGSTSNPLPARVTTLDENFLVFNPRQRPRCSPALEGFHFYGTDTCLNAALDGGTAYVIDFPVTHLSGGRLGTSYYAAKARFLATWRRRMIFTFVRAPTESLFISRFALLRRLFGSQRMLAWVQEVVPSLRLDTDDSPESAT
jgi:hypothetical protein